MATKHQNVGEIYLERGRCPLYTALSVIAGRWKPMIFQRLGPGPQGFGELRRNMPGVTAKVLRQQLRQLEAAGLVAHRVQTVPTLRVKYRLTKYGRTLGPVFEILWRWGTRHLERPRSLKNS